MSGMASKPSTTSNLDSDMARELEEALDIDLFVDDKSDGGLDVASSMADFEAQISKAAEDLARDSRARQVQKPAPAPVVAEAAAPKPAPRPKQPDVKPIADLKPIEPAQPTPPFTHANDDRQKDYRSLQQQLRRNGSGAIYWMVSLLSLAWIAGGLLM